MNAFELLSKWPAWEKAGAEAIFDSPAWVMPTHWGDAPCFMRRADLKERDVIGIAVRFDDEENFIGIGNREAFPDLHTLWEQKKQLPDALVLALIEKECGKLFQILENAVRRQLTVSGLAPAEKREGATGFEILDSNGNILVSFVMKVTPEIIRAMGTLKCLNINHEAIRDMTRDAVAEYVSFAMPQDQIASIEPGDYILMPELDQTEPKWILGAPADTRVHVCAPEPSSISFAQFVDEDLPDCPDPSSLALIYQGRTIANGRLDTLEDVSVFVVEEVL